MIKLSFVSVNGVCINKPSFSVKDGDIIALDNRAFIDNRLYVSRGAFKLQNFLRDDNFGVVVSDLDSMDKTTQSLRGKAKACSVASPHLQIYNKTTQLNITNIESRMDCFVSLCLPRNDDNKKISSHIKQLIKNSINNAIAIDIGASSGGFTQVLLANNAKLVVAQDVGTLQLDSVLKNDSRVISLENMDIRHFCKNKTLILESIFCKEKIDSNIRAKPFHILTCDVSFISLHGILDSIFSLSDMLILLFKPQFEVGKDIKRNKHGVVMDKKAINNALDSILQRLHKLKAKLIYVEKSLLKGRAGNEEFFIFCQC